MSATPDLAYIDSMRLGHGILASLAWLIFFPAGAISLRIIPGKLAVYIHIFSQLFAYLLFTAAVGMGIHLALYFQIVAATNYFHYAHGIIGLLVFSAAALQVILGTLHHVVYRTQQKRTGWSYAHIWLGRILVTLAMINGGLGLMLTEGYQMELSTGYAVYGAVAGFVWCLFVGVAVWGEVKRGKSTGEEGEKGRSISESGSEVEKFAVLEGKITV